MTVLEKAKAKLDAAQRGMSYRLPGYDKSDLQWWTAYIEGAEDQKREDAAAIEALQAEQKKTVTQIFGEEQQEWEEYCTGLMNRIKELKAQLPKRGKWKATEMYMTDECTACGFLMNWEDVPACLFNLPHFNDRCPNCGAKMEVQDESAGSL